MFVSPDFNKEERLLRKQLVEEMKARSDGKKAFMHHWENRFLWMGRRWSGLKLIRSYANTG